MASKITTAIGQSNFELIRDRICTILAEEITAQSTILSKPELKATVWNERTVPFDFTNCPAINVLFSRANANAYFPKENVYINTFFIDIYTSDKTNSTTDGGTRSTWKLHRLAGIVRAILENPIYRTLDFTPPSIETTSVTDISIADPKPNQDGANIMMGRLTFTVQCRETTELKTAVALGGATTQIKMSETNEGYFYEIQIGD